MNLLLMPIVVSVYGVSLFSLPILIGLVMRFFSKTAHAGKRILVYSSFVLVGGVAGCWVGFLELCLSWSWERHAVRWGNIVLSLPIALFWASVPVGIVLGAILGRRFLESSTREINLRSRLMNALDSQSLLIPEVFHDAMIAHCVREAPLECCGLLGGVAPVVSSIHPLRNASASEVRYDADPRDLIEAVQSLRARKAEILAIYHSHPRWAAIPSKTDLAENHYGDVPRIIVSLLGETPEVRVWRLDVDSYEELPWSIMPGSS